MSTEHEGVGRPSDEDRTDETSPADRVPQSAPTQNPPKPQSAPPAEAPDLTKRSQEAPADGTKGGEGRDSGPARSAPTAQLRRITPAAPPPPAAAPPAPGDDAATQHLPPVPSGSQDGEAPTQHLPPVSPGADSTAGHPQQVHPAPGPQPGGTPAAGAPAYGSHPGPGATHGGAYGAGAGGAYGGAYGGDTPYGGGPGGGNDHWGAPLPPQPKRRRGGGLLAAVLVAALLAGGIGGGVGYWAADRNSSSSSDTVSAPGNAGERSATSVAGIASKALPSVVTIQLNGGTGNSGGGTGTGFVFDKQGHIMTNNHVVAAGDGDAELTVVFSDGEKYEAEVVGRAEGYDVAVIKLRNPGDATLTPLPLGKSDEVAVGDATVAIGAPFGLSGTVTTGIVSALNRPVASSDGQGGSASSYMSALQTDASINPGNSGGPLLNDAGAVIGVNSAIQSTSDGMGGSSGSIGLGFAIPIDQAKRVAKNLIETGEPVYPIIGASVDMRGQGGGAEVADEADDGSESVIPGGPADKAGLRGGDVITKLNDTQIDSGPTLISEIWTYEPGDKVKLTYERDGRQATTTVTLGQRTGD